MSGLGPLGEWVQEEHSVLTIAVFAPSPPSLFLWDKYLAVESGRHNKDQVCEAFHVLNVIFCHSTLLPLQQ